MTEPKTSTLDVPGARLYYEVRGSGPLVALVGAPMDAGAFAPLADLLPADHTVVTVDPRGVNRSVVDDPDADSTPEQRADDLARVIETVGAGPATVFGSSGGAVTSLALLQARPELVDTVVAHEPPLEELLADRDRRRASQEAIVEAYRTEGSFAAWRLFLGAANLGDAAPDATGSPIVTEPDPQAAADERHFFLHEMRPTVRFVPDLDRLRGRKLVIGIGADSTDQTCDLTSRALGEALDVEPTSFPGGHVGFVEDPAVFATSLRAVLAERAN